MSTENLSRETDLYDRLAERASRRFELERRIQWRNTAALWAMFGFGAVAVLMTPTWTPTASAAALATLFTIVVLVVYAGFYLPQRLRKLHRDNEIAYWWDTQLQKSLGDLHLPAGLEPGPDWPSAVPSSPPPAEGMAGGDERGTAPAEKPRPAKRWWHCQCWQILHNVEFAIAVALAFLFVAVVWNRTELHRPATRVLIEGQGLQVESLNGIRLPAEAK